MNSLKLIKILMLSGLVNNNVQSDENSEESWV